MSISLPAQSDNHQVERAPSQPFGGRGLGNIKLWILLALGFTALMIFVGEARSDSSIFWFLDPLMMAVLLALIWLHERLELPRLHLHPILAAILFIGLSWLTGMLVELTLSAGGGDSFGGLHPNTIPSFIFAQVYYWPFALLGWFFIRNYRLTLKDVFFIGGVASLFEMTAYSLSALFSPFFFLFPLVFAYYFTVYGSLLAWPLIALDEKFLWKENAKPVSRRRKLVVGLLIGGLSALSLGFFGTIIETVLAGYLGF